MRGAPHFAALLFREKFYVYETGAMEKDMKKRILSLLALLALTAALCVPAAAASALPFTDVPEDYWAYKTILFSYQNNLVKGKSDVAFQPEAPMTMGQYMTVLYRIGVQLKAGYPAKATTGANWLEAAKYLCSQYGTHMTDSTMNTAITREEMAYFGAQMVSSVCKANNVAAKVIHTAKLTDAAKINAAHRDSVTWFYSVGGIGGYGDGTFRPTATLTRSQGVTVFYNIFNIVLPNLQKA